MRIGVIGAGNLATAVLTGSIRNGAFPAEDFYLYDLFTDKVNALHDSLGTQIAGSPADVAAQSDVVILAVKPKDFAALLQQIEPALSQKDPLVISVAAGLSTAYVGSFLPYGAKIARIMTNINASVGGAMTAYCFGSRVTQDEKDFLQRFCLSFGDAVELEETMFAQFGVLAGCVPAFAYKFVDEIARAGVQIGVRKDLALRIAAQTVLGSARVAGMGEVHPYALIDRVCTPGGTTIEGIAALDALGFSDAVHQSVLRAYEKDLALAKTKEQEKNK